MNRRMAREELPLSLYHANDPVLVPQSRVAALCRLPYLRAFNQKFVLLRRDNEYLHRLCDIFFKRHGLRVLAAFSLKVRFEAMEEPAQ